MAGVGLGGAFASDPNPNPFEGILPHGGAVLGDNGEPVVDEPYIDQYGFSNDEEGWDPPTGNGLTGPKYGSTDGSHWQSQPGLIVADFKQRFSGGISKLDQLKLIEENIRDLLMERRRLLSDLKTERDEINKRLNVSEDVTKALDEMFPDNDDEPEFVPESEDE